MYCYVLYTCIKKVFRVFHKLWDSVKNIFIVEKKERERERPKLPAHLNGKRVIFHFITSFISY